MRKIFLSLAALAVTAAAPHSLQSMSDAQLFNLSRHLFDEARAEQSDNGPARVEGAKVEKELARRGWCFGPDDASQSEMNWMRTGPTCHPST